MSRKTSNRTVGRPSLYPGNMTTRASSSTTSTCSPRTTATCTRARCSRGTSPWPSTPSSTGSPTTTSSAASPPCPSSTSASSTASPTSSGAGAARTTTCQTGCGRRSSTSRGKETNKENLFGFPMLPSWAESFCRKGPVFCSVWSARRGKKKAKIAKLGVKPYTF